MKWSWANATVHEEKQVYKASTVQVIIVDRSSCADGLDGFREAHSMEDLARIRRADFGFEEAAGH